MKIGIIYYGAGNIGNICNTLKLLNTNFDIIDRESKINSCDKLILPGQGAFGRAIENMREHGLFDGINNHIYKEKYVLGICLGMQLMHESSNEFGEIYKGFNHFSGSVNKMTSEILPRIGWGKITSIKKQQQHSVFSSILENDRYYFSHSMHCNSEERYTTSYSEYFNTRIVATIVNKSLFGTQFHPELSGKRGLEILKNFIDL